jgi:hypothetical protein
MSAIPLLWLVGILGLTNGLGVGVLLATLLCLPEARGNSRHFLGLALIASLAAMAALGPWSLLSLYCSLILLLLHLRSLVNTDKLRARLRTTFLLFVGALVCGLSLRALHLVGGHSAFLEALSPLLGLVLWLSQTLACGFYLGLITSMVWDFLKTLPDQSNRLAFALEVAGGWMCLSGVGHAYRGRPAYSVVIRTLAYFGFLFTCLSLTAKVMVNLTATIYPSPWMFLCFVVLAVAVVGWISLSAVAASRTSGVPSLKRAAVGVALSLAALSVLPQIVSTLAAGI